MIRNENSRAAYAAIMASGKISASRKAVYRYLHEHGPATRNQIDRALGNGEPNPAYSRRLTELEAMGLIARVGTTGRTGRIGSDLWDVTECSEPKPIQKRRTRRQALESAFRIIKRLVHGSAADVFMPATIESIRKVVEATDAEVSA